MPGLSRRRAWLIVHYGTAHPDADFVVSRQASRRFALHGWFIVGGLAPTVGWEVFQAVNHVGVYLRYRNRTITDEGCKAPYQQQLPVTSQCHGHKLALLIYIQ